MTDLTEAVNDAVNAAKDAYDSVDENPFDHGFAHVEVDGRTRLYKALKSHDDVNADDSDYVTIAGVSRYLTAQRKAYREFVETLESHGVDTDHVATFGRLD